MSRATLVVMAAGIGSRFGGGIKQLAPVGPGGEIIMDYSIYDAMEAGFDKVVFVIRKDLDDAVYKTKKEKYEAVVNAVKGLPVELNLGGGGALDAVVVSGIVAVVRALPCEKDLDAIVTRKGLVPATWEGVAVRFSDSIAYLGRDWEDARRLGLLEGCPPLPEDVAEVLGRSNSAIINNLVMDLIENSGSSGMGFSDRMYQAILEMSRYNYRYIYRSELLEGYTRYFTRLIRLIVGYLDELMEKYGTDRKGYDEERNMLAAGFYAHLMELKDSYLEREGNLDRLVLDYVAGMSDNFALDCANEILKPEHLNDRIEQSQRGKWFDVQ